MGSGRAKKKMSGGEKRKKRWITVEFFETKPWNDDENWREV